MDTFLVFYVISAIINITFFRFVFDKPKDMDDGALRVLGVFVPFVNVGVAFGFCVIAIFYGLYSAVNGKPK